MTRLALLYFPESQHVPNRGEPGGWREGDHDKINRSDPVHMERWMHQGTRCFHQNRLSDYFKVLGAWYMK